MKIKVKIDGIEGLNASLQRFADAVGKDVSAILPDEARLYCVSAMTAQPPTVGGNIKGANTAAAKRNGENAVKQSHRSTAPVWDESNFGTPGLKNAYRKGDAAEIQRLLEAAGSPTRVSGAFDPAMIQSQRRNGRTGRGARRTVLVTGGAAQGRDSYTKAKQSNVGMMKGSWAALIEKLNGYTTAKSRIPSWIARNASKGQAWLSTGVTVALSGSRKRIEIRGATQPAMAQFEGIALRSRIKSIEKKTREILKGRAAIINGKFTILPRR